MARPIVERAARAMPQRRPPGDHDVMFLLPFGLGTRIKDRGELAARACPRCGSTRAWRQLERCDYLAVFFVRLLPWKREQLAACPVCGHPEPLGEAHLHPVPALHPRPLAHAWPWAP